MHLHNTIGQALSLLATNGSACSLVTRLSPCLQKNVPTEHATQVLRYNNNHLTIIAHLAVKNKTPLPCRGQQIAEGYYSM
ncbi:hypothetical protein DFP73DRAFT_26949 [Morchella snyderi]|nr:hypothetical protein DFP73DRAFT_26949 [Morchella snyderi]